MRGNCFKSRHEENRLIPVASLGLVLCGPCGHVCGHGTFPMYCTVIILLFFLFVYLFLFALCDLSSCLPELGRARSLSIVMLWEGAQ